VAELFPAAPETLQDPHVTYSPGVFRGRWTVEELRALLPLEQKTCVMYGQTLKVPRLECWFSDSGKPYRFGGRVEHPKPWPTVALAIKGAVEELAGERFDSCFVNFYRDGGDTIAWHADDDSWIGPVIASLSFGVARRFCMKRKNKSIDTPAEFSLGDGDVLVMHAGVQSKWLHRVPRESGVSAPRINFTFRQTVPA
jgi:alkylated DNA repair dioxygenase AlkB